MDRSRRDVPVEPDLHLVQDGTAVGVIAKPKNRQEHCLLEGAEGVCHQECAYIVDQMTTKASRDPWFGGWLLASGCWLLAATSHWDSRIQGSGIHD